MFPSLAFTHPRGIIFQHQSITPPKGVEYSKRQATSKNKTKNQHQPPPLAVVVCEEMNSYAKFRNLEMKQEKKKKLRIATSRSQQSHSILYIYLPTYLPSTVHIPMGGWTTSCSLLAGPGSARSRSTSRKTHKLYKLIPSETWQTSSESTSRPSEYFVFASQHWPYATDEKAITFPSGVGWWRCQSTAKPEKKS